MFNGRCSADDGDVAARETTVAQFDGAASWRIAS
jgi:hypothetical protein